MGQYMQLGLLPDHGVFHDSKSKHPNGTNGLQNHFELYCETQLHSIHSSKTETKLKNTTDAKLPVLKLGQAPHLPFLKLCPNFDFC
jgi:hypothetical protein